MAGEWDVVEEAPFPSSAPTPSNPQQPAADPWAVVAEAPAAPAPVTPFEQALAELESLTTSAEPADALGAEIRNAKINLATTKVESLRREMEASYDAVGRHIDAAGQPAGAIRSVADFYRPDANRINRSLTPGFDEGRPESSLGGIALTHLSGFPNFLRQRGLGLRERLESRLASAMSFEDEAARREAFGAIVEGSRKPLEQRSERERDLLKLAGFDEAATYDEIERQMVGGGTPEFQDFMSRVERRLQGQNRNVADLRDQVEQAYEREREDRAGLNIKPYSLGHVVDIITGEAPKMAVDVAAGMAVGRGAGGALARMRGATSEAGVAKSVGDLTQAGSFGSLWERSYTMTYNDGIREGLSDKQASERAVAHAHAEAVAEILPLKMILDVRPGKGLTRRLVDAGLSEGISESITEALQTGYDHFNVEGKEVTLGELLDNMGQAAFGGAVLGVTMRGGTETADAISGRRKKAEAQAEPTAEEVMSQIGDRFKGSADKSTYDAIDAEMQDVGVEIKQALDAMPPEASEQEGYKAVTEIMRERGISPAKAPRTMVERLVSAHRRGAATERPAAGGATEGDVGAIGEDLMRLSDLAVEGFDSLPEFMSPRRFAVAREDIEAQRAGNEKAENRYLATAVRDLERQAKVSRDSFDPDHHTLYDAVAIGGGLDQAQLGGEVDIITANQGRVGRPVVRKAGTGRSMDEMAEYLNQLGFRTRDGSELDPNSLADLLDEESRGKRIFSMNRQNSGAFDADRQLSAFADGDPKKLASYIRKYLEGGELGIRQRRAVQAAIEQAYESGQITPAEAGGLEAGTEALAPAMLEAGFGSGDRAALEAVRAAYEAQVPAQSIEEAIRASGGDPGALADSLETLAGMVPEDAVDRARASTGQMPDIRRLTDTLKALREAGDKGIKGAMRKAGVQEPKRGSGRFAQPFRQDVESKAQAAADVAYRHNLTPEATAEMFQALFPSAGIDAVTGFYKAEQRAETMARAQEYLAGSDVDGFYIEVDLSNLGGLNAAKGHSGANKAYRSIARVLSSALSNGLGKGDPAYDQVNFRHGGDEMSFFVFGAKVDQSSIEEVLRRAQETVWKYARSQGVHEIPHAKQKDDPTKVGVNFYFGVSKIASDAAPEMIFEIADKQVEAAKKEPSYGYRKREEAGAVRTEPGAARRQAGRDGEGDRRVSRARRAGEPGAQGAPEGAGRSGGEVRLEAGQAGREATLDEGRAEGLSDGGAQRPADAAPRNLKERREREDAAKRSQDGVEERRRGDDRTGDIFGAEPTDAQKEAGNYKKEHVRMHGLDIAIENRRGSVRRGKDEGGREWETTLAHDYGYIKRTEGNDGDHVDVFVGPNLTSDKAFVVNQTGKGGAFDEHKVMLGFSSAKAAEEGYLANYDAGWDRFSGIVPMSTEQLKAWLRDGDMTKPAEAPAPATDLFGKSPEEEAAQRRADAGAARDAKQARDAERAAKMSDGPLFDGSQQQTDIADAKPAADNITEAGKILDAAGIAGSDKLDAIAKVRRGEYTLDDLRAAFPQQDQALEPAEVDIVDSMTEVADVTNTVIMEAVDRRDRSTLGYLHAKHDGTKAGAEAAARRLVDEAHNSFNYFSPSYSRIGATGQNGEARWMVNPNKLTAHPVDSKEAEDLGYRWEARVKAFRESAVPAADAGGAIGDLGEKIGGARKDTAAKTGPKGKSKQADDRPVWARRFEISQIVSGSPDLKEEGKWVVRDTKNKDWHGQPRQVGGLHDSREEAESIVPALAVAVKHRAVPGGVRGEYEIWRDISDRKRVKVVKQSFPSREDALRYMAEHAVEIIETNTTFGEADLPRPDNVKRKGVERRKGNVAGQDFMSAFGFRGVEFGNWNSQDERQEVMNAAYDGLLDLAEVLGLPPRAISLNGDLALAFGARGHGLTGSRAHYETEKAVINLTKMNGAGALAHEWFHALDHYLARQDGKASSMWVTDKDGTRSLKVRPDAEDDMASSGLRKLGAVREEVREAYMALMNTIANKAEKYVEDSAKAEKFVADVRKNVADQLDGIRKYLAAQLNPQYYKRNNKPASAEQLAEFDTIAEKILRGESLTTKLTEVKGAKSKSFGSGMRFSNEALEKIGEIYKAVRGRSGFTSESKGPLDELRGHMARYQDRLKMLADAQQGSEKERQVPTEFRMDAKSLDQGRGTDYWATPHELAARAFQGYVEDKIAEQGGASPFLNYGPENVGIDTPWGVKRPYPAGQERKDINAAFDRLAGVFKTRETDKGLALYSLSSPWRSGLRDAVVSSKQDKAPASQWKAIIQKLPGAKREEIEWVGVLDWLDGLASEPVTKQQVADFIDANGLQIEDVVKATPESLAERISGVAAHYGYTVEDDYGEVSFFDENGDPVDFDDLPAGLQIEVEEEPQEAKYGRWQLPGGTDYRELLLTLPQRPGARKAVFEKYLDQLNALFDASRDYSLPDDLRNKASQEYFDLVQKRDREADEVGRQVASDYTTPHWDEENVLAHVRFNTRAGANGERILHIEEIQSDWHQEGRKRGYKQKRGDAGLSLDRASEPGFILIRDKDGNQVGGYSEAAAYGMTDQQLLDRFASGQGGTDAVPDAPFKDTGAWSMLAMKRMIRYAVDKGFDAITWTGGKAQVDRYDISKEVKHIDYSVDGRLIVTAKDGSVVHNERTAEDGIADVIGKEAADRLIGQPLVDLGSGSARWRRLEGDGLKVGGKGMVAFYDKILPAETNKLLKKYGGKVERFAAATGVGTSVRQGSDGRWLVEYANGNKAFVSSEAQAKAIAANESGRSDEFLGLRITDALRAAAQGGLPMFRMGQRGYAGARVSELAKAIDAAKKDIPGLSAEPVQSIADLPRYLVDAIDLKASRGEIDPSKIEGLFDPSTGKTFVVADNVSSAERGVEVALHEDVGHFGPRALLGEQHEAVMLQIERSFRSDPRFIEVRNRYGLKNLSREDRALAADEFVARLAESGTLAAIAKQKPLGAIGRLFRAIREALQRMGLVKWTDRDIERLLARSVDAINRRRAVERGDGAPTFAMSSGRAARRAPWGDFPPVVIAAPLSAAAGHPDGAAAKTGDADAAYRLVRDVLPADVVERLRETLGGRRPVIVPVVALESSGDNAIPVVLAERLAQDLGGRVEYGVVQGERVGRTGMDGWARLANQPTFDGSPDLAGAPVILVDDTLTQGGTLASLRGHLAGADIVSAVALTGKQYSATLAISDQQLQALRAKYGELEGWWHEQFGYGFDALTASEARFILHADLPAEQVRARLVAAIRRGDGQEGPGADGGGEGQQEVGPRFSLAGRTDSPAFKRWFGDSKAVDAEGKPLVVYHGTGRSFSTFKRSKSGNFGSGIYLASDPDQADAFAYGDGDTGANIMPLYVSIKRPFYTSADYNVGEDADVDSPAVPLIREVFGKDANKVMARLRNSESGHLGDAVRKRLEEAGHDGIIATYADGSKEYIAFRPEQIKSVYNRGTFDPANPDIRFSIRGQGSDLPPEIRDDISSTHAIPEARSFVDRLRDAFGRVSGINWLEVRQGFIDSFAAIADLETSVNGGLLDAGESAYKAALMTKNHTGVMATVLHHKQVKHDGQWFSIDQESEPFMAIFEPLAAEPGLLRLWEHWAGAVRANRLLAEGRERNYTQEQVDRVLAFVRERPELSGLFNETHRRWREFNRRTLDMAEAAGVIDPAERVLWAKDDYVPFHRVLEEQEEVRAGRKVQGLSGQTSGIRRLQGGEGKVSILESMLLNTMHLVDASYKNVAMRKVVDLAEGVAMERVDMDWKPVKLTDAQLAGALRKHGIEVESLDEEQRKAWSTLFTRTIPQGRDIVSVMRDGKREWYRVSDPLLLRAITAIGPDPYSRLIELLGIPKSVLTTMVTADPGFMVRNFMRDTLSTWAVVNPKGLPQEYKKRVMIDAVRGAVKSFRNDEKQWAIMAAGAGNEGQYSVIPEDIRRALTKIKGLQSTLDTPRKTWAFWQRVGRSFEYANRLAVYENVQKAGGSEAEAAFQAMDVLNFSRRGEWAAVRFLTAVVPFLNARIQGLDRLYRGGKENPGAFFLKGAMLVAASMALMLAHDDDDRYWALPEWDRDTYWHFWVGDEHFRIPKPFEVGAIFATIPERIYGQAADKEDSKVLVDAAVRMIAGTFAFNPMPQAFMPGLEAALNFSVFGGMRPIVSEAAEDFKRPEDQHEPWTSESARVIAEAMPDSAPDFLRSPMKVEHMVRGYFGTLGSYALMGADHVSRWLGDYPDAPDTPVAQMPVIGSFWRQGETATKYPAEFYEMLREVNQVNNRVKVYAQLGMKQEAQRVAGENRLALSARPGLAKVAQDMAEIRRQIRAVYADPNMAGDRKLEEIQRLHKKRNELAKVAVDRFGGVLQ